jgi:hypothetical protein
VRFKIRIASAAVNYRNAQGVSEQLVLMKKKCELCYPAAAADDCIPSSQQPCPEKLSGPSSYRRTAGQYRYSLLCTVDRVNRGVDQGEPPPAIPHLQPSENRKGVLEDGEAKKKKAHITKKSIHP